MKHIIKRISVIGDGSWGTTLAVYLARKGFDVALWGPFEDYLRQVQATRINSKFLPDIEIPESVSMTHDLTTALHQTDLVVLALPSKYIMRILKKIAREDIGRKVFLSVIKGIEYKTLTCMSQVIKRELGKVPLAVLSGPTIAREVALGIPSSAVIASEDPRLAQKLQDVFNSDRFRIYTNSDVIGLELGGSLKNIIAIACGVCDGLGFGTNAKAAILSRGLAEIARLGHAMGARADTFAGLAGLGDLVTTCISSQSRNRYVGEQLGRGESITSILNSMDMVAEGVETVRAAVRLSKRYKISMPITTEVYRIIYQKKKPQNAVQALMTRKVKSE